MIAEGGKMVFTIKSEGIVEGVIKNKYGKLSKEVLNGIPQRSIPLNWQGCPEGTKSFVIIFLDNDNYEEQGISWLHWSVANIPVNVNVLEENCSLNIEAVDQGILQGKNSWMSELSEEEAECNRYGGPAPMAFAHEYELKIYALDKFLDLENGYYHNLLLRAMKGTILGEAALYGKYNIQKG